MVNEHTLRQRLEGYCASAYHPNQNYPATWASLSAIGRKLSGTKKSSGVAFTEDSPVNLQSWSVFCHWCSVSCGCLFLAYSGSPCYSVVMVLGLFGLRWRKGLNTDCVRVERGCTRPTPPLIRLTLYFLLNSHRHLLLLCFLLPVCDTHARHQRHGALRSRHLNICN